MRLLWNYNICNKAAYLLILICCFQHSNLLSQTLTVSGYVRDSHSGEPLQEANIFYDIQKRGCTSSKTGYYKIYLSEGGVDLKCSYVGYLTRQFNFVLSHDTIINIILTQDNLLKNVVVYAPLKGFGVNSSQMSSVQVPISQIKSVPALFGEIDVMKVLQLLPGVQSGGDGNAGIFVRGGNYDQNMITLDGSTLYNADHLKGFVSALNADVIQNVVLYKGGFPARYGSRLSSVVDVGIKEGDYERYHAAITLGVLSSKLYTEGPLKKGVSSFNFAARLSYFNLIAHPILDKISTIGNTLASYANMNYYDINSKITHRLSSRDKISAVFYLGNDVADMSPSDSKKQYSLKGIDFYQGDKKYTNKRSNTTENRWGNLVSSIYWNRVINNQWNSNINLSYSHYDYNLKMSSHIENETIEIETNKELSFYLENSWATYRSGISDIALAADFNYLPHQQHNIRMGAKFSSQHFRPMVDVYKYSLKRVLRLNSEYFTEEKRIDTVVGNKRALNTLSVYVEDDVSWGEYFKFNIGLRYTMFAVENRTYHSLEPRLSGRVLLNHNLAFKASFSMMQQGIHLLSSSNLVMPSDIWVPITEKFKPMKSYQFAAGLNYELQNGIDLSLEGYYKTMSNVLEYMEGTSYMNASDSWEEMVAMGKGWSYGVEAFAQKKAGKSTGWISYTWSKALRQFDQPGQLISAGDKFYANNDCRHNLSVTLSHRLGKAFELSGTFVLNSGKRGILATDVMYGGILDEYDSYCIPITLSSGNSEEIIAPDGFSERQPNGIAYFRKQSRFNTFSQRNNFELPLYHRLDFGISCFLFHESGKSTINLSIYNLYNQQNISNVYIGYHNNKTVLKGVCLLPFMPSINYCYQF